ncbi:MAG: type II restriction-modification system subunit M [Candidatus Desulfovibrio kirbyi]|uniref:site-specific DNA-methyltransferase (adenine-specific) n=1 Tax=Candidatus Desulfovibrio kirbyi TaxID=2696086 RepID=A0A6L2R661_9BACT|nr:MAG: type II restriction-modification system subunit M [Candidatus Desulfovibrio kirbyi]
MTAIPLSQLYFENHLYDRNFFEQELPHLLAPVADIESLFHTVKSLVDVDLLTLSEPQLENSVIKPILDLLGWSPLPQEHKVIQGKTLIPDWTLFAKNNEKDAYLALPSTERPASLQGVVTFTETKTSDQPLDTKKANRDNPYFQMLEYLNFTRIPFGFLTNGREWWLVDNQKISSQKQYIRVYLDRIIKNSNLDAFRRFYHLFARESFVTDEPSVKTKFEQLTATDLDRRTASEEDLKKVIYGIDGRESLFEQAGKSIFASTKHNATPENLKNVFENTLYFVFRILFISYFEDRHWDLLETHSNYPGLSLRHLFDSLDNEAPNGFSGWNDLQRLFSTLDKGNPNLSIPLLNGGLFDEGQASLLNKPKVMDNHTLRSILEKLYLMSSEELSGRRDFQSLSVTHLGTIYEGLLEYEFRVAEEDLFYLDYKKRGSRGVDRLDGYFDLYDAEHIRHDSSCTNIADTKFPKDALYLVGSRNSRKTSASYYTPQSLSFPLVKRAIDHQLANIPEDKSILDLRILDNACGSGHLLVESLIYLTRRALDRIADDDKLQKVLAEEKSRIDAVMVEIGLANAEVDEFAVLKRILLKRTLYGVDIQPFAIELAQLGLWIETFVFGTPLSLIEHHVKAGNSLIGTTIKTFKEAMNRSGQQMHLMDITMKDHFAHLQSIYNSLNALQDTTAEDVQESKALFRDEIRPALAEMNLLLDILNYKSMLLAEGKREEADKINIGDVGPQIIKKENEELKEQILSYRSKYGFFNWEIEFTEVFTTNEPGFHIIVGNPPWDKTKFEDPMFFEQYRSNYRSLSNSKKSELKTDLLAKPYIKQKYENQQKYTMSVNEYLKAVYPFNSGSGDGNLYRFFVEKNINLLTRGGTLNYVLPTSLLTDDGSGNLRKHIFKHLKVNAFDGFENRENIFPDVHSSYKFGLLQIERRTDPEQKARTRFMLTNPDVLSTETGIVEYGLDDIKAISPDHFAYMEVGGGRADIELLTRFYRKFPSLSPEWLDFRAELHATKDKRIFIEQHRNGLLPLYKGASIWQFDSLYGEQEAGLPEYWLDGEKFDDHLRATEIKRLIADVYPALSAPEDLSHTKAVLESLNLIDKAELGQFVVPDRNFYRLGFRGIARDTDERTLIAALVPKDIGAQNSLPLSMPKRYYLNVNTKKISIKAIPITRLLFAQAIFNSISTDWILRFSVGINVTKSFLMRQPIPQPADDELHTNPIYAELVKNSALLSLHYNKNGFIDVQYSLEIGDSEIPSTAKHVEMLKIRNDILVADIYGISKPEMGYMLSSFKVLWMKKPQYCKTLLSEMPI